MNKIITKIFSLFIVVFILLNFANTIFAKEETNIYLFGANSCPHCKDEKVFLENLIQKYNGVNLKYYEVTSSKEDANLLVQIKQHLNINTAGVPFTLIGKTYIIGFSDEATTGKYIENILINEIENPTYDVISEINQESIPKQEIPQESQFNLPFLGEVDAKNISLPLLSVSLGFVDGFNPCAMWALVFLISLLLGMKDRKRMWILGITFIVTSAFVYFLFLVAWLNLFIFLGYITIIRILIGIVALAAGGYSLYDYHKNKDGGCKITNNKERRLIFEKLRDVAKSKNFIYSMVGIIILAFAVNLIELICSAGLPAIYTQILAINNLNSLSYFINIFIYIFFFMIDDLFVFFIAMTTLHAVGIHSKYSRISRLVGGIIILIIGVLLIFKPEILTFSI